MSLKQMEIDTATGLAGQKLFQQAAAQVPVDEPWLALENRVRNEKISFEAATLAPDADIHEVVRTMTDFNLAVAPVLSDDGQMLGQITVDDVLELLLPTGWRRQYGMASHE